jgi:hypothetical protein
LRVERKRCCPGLRHAPFIASDMLSDGEVTALKSFWIWEPLKEKWEYIRDWEDHKRGAMQKFEAYVKEKPAGIRPQMTATAQVLDPVNSAPATVPWPETIVSNQAGQPSDGGYN